MASLQKPDLEPVLQALEQLIDKDQELCDLDGVACASKQNSASRPLQRATVQLFHFSKERAKAVKYELHEWVNLDMVDEVCTSLADSCISLAARPIFQTISRPAVLERVKFLDACLVRPGKFLRSAREQAWRKYYSCYLTNMPHVQALTGSAQASTWLCLRLFEKMLDVNYTLPTANVERLQECADLGIEARDIVSYIGGHIITKVKQRVGKLSQTETKDDVLGCLEKFLTTREQSEGQKFTDTINRGRLVYLKPRANQFFHLLEVETRKICQGTDPCKLFAFEERCSGDEVIKTCFHAITADFSKDTKEIVFSKLTQFFFKIRVHHECKLFKEKLRAKTTQQKKGLRKSMILKDVTFATVQDD